MEQHNGRAILRQTPALEHYPSYFLLTDGTAGGELPVNEDDEVGFPEVTHGGGAESEGYVLCGTCGGR